MFYDFILSISNFSFPAISPHLSKTQNALRFFIEIFMNARNRWVAERYLLLFTGKGFTKTIGYNAGRIFIRWIIVIPGQKTTPTPPAILEVLRMLLIFISSMF
jgi:hypothetical protein